MPRSALDRAVEELINREGDSHDDTDDFDKKVAALIVQEAREKNGASARGLSSSSHLSEPRHHTNTRFLNYIVRSVQSHNKAVLKASSHVQTDRMDRYHPSIQAKRDNHLTGSDDHNNRPGRMRAWSGDDGDGNITTTSKNVSNERKRSGNDRTSEDEKRQERKRRRSRNSSDREHRGETIDITHHSNSSSSRSKNLGKHSENGQSSKEKSEKQDNIAEESPPSKMDRYFSTSYNPLFDVKAVVRQNASGLIEDDGWDRMLMALKEKKERKRARKGESIEARRSRHRGKPTDPVVGANLLDTQYHKRGAMREWDKGKETLLKD